MAVAGVCHSDDHFATGDMVPTPELAAIMEATGAAPLDYFPLLGGHEGAGVVEEVGPGVQSVQPGDRVSFSFIAACGACRWCVSGMTYLCDNGAMMLAKEMTTDGTTRRHLGDEDLTAMTQLGTFAEYAVLAEESVIKIDDVDSLRGGLPGVVRRDDGLGLWNCRRRNATGRHRGHCRHRRGGDQRRPRCPRRGRQRRDRGGSR